MIEVLSKLPAWTREYITADADNDLKLHEIYLVPNKEGELVVRAWRLGRVYEPYLMEDDEETPRKSHESWAKYVKNRPGGLKKRDAQGRLGYEVDIEKSRRFQRVVLKGNEIVWVSDQVDMICK